MEKRDLAPLWAIVMLGVGLLLLFWEVPLWGYVQVPADIPPFYDPALQEALPEGVVRPQNPLLSDHIYQFYVWHTLAAEEMQRTGHIPLWNPYLLAGQPLVANAQPALFYPPNLLLFWFDAGVVATVRLFFNVLVAGFFSFCWARALGVSPAGAMLAGLSFAFSGALVVGPSHAYANCLVWLPFMLWAGEKVLAGTRVYFWGLVTAVGVGMSVLGGHPESTFHNLLLWGLYVAARLGILVWQRVKIGRLVLAFGVALGVGLLLGGVQGVPFVVWLGQSGTTSRSVAWGGKSVFYSESWLAHLATLVTLWFPGFFGHPVAYTYRWPLATFQNFLEQSMYVGLVTLALAVAGVLAVGRAVQHRQRPSLLIITLLAGFCLVVALRLPGFEVVNHLPLFDRVNNTRLKWYFAFFVAILAGFGLDMVRAYLVAGEWAGRRSWGAATAVWGIGLGVVGLMVVGKWYATAVSPFPSDSFTHYLLFTIFSLAQRHTVISLLVLLLGSLAYALMRRFPRYLVWLPHLLLSLTFAELIVLARGYNTTVPPETIFPEVRLTQLLRQDGDLFRILTIPPTFWPNYGAVYGFYDVGGYDLPVYKPYAELYLAQGGEGYRQTWSPDWPLVDWMNIKYVIGLPEQTGAKWQSVWAEGYRVYQNREVLPRAFMVYAVQVEPEAEQARQLLVSGTFPLATAVLLAEALPDEQATAVTPPANYTGLQPEAVTITTFHHDSVTLTANTPTPGLLVMSDVYAPGWQVLVDDQPATLLRANYTFRAVFVPAGAHRVTFFYDPPEVRVGKWLTAVALLLLLIGLPLCWWRGEGGELFVDG